MPSQDAWMPLVYTCTLGDDSGTWVNQQGGVGVEGGGEGRNRATEQEVRIIHTCCSSLCCGSVENAYSCSRNRRRPLQLHGTGDSGPTVDQPPHAPCSLRRCAHAPTCKKSAGMGSKNTPGDPFTKVDTAAVAVLPPSLLPSTVMVGMSAAGARNVTVYLSGRGGSSVAAHRR